MERYYYSRDGTDVQGPISDDDLWRMVQVGILPQLVQVCREGTEDWVTISQPPEPLPTFQIVVQPNTPEKTDNERSERVVEIIRNYGWGAMGAMVVIPVPGADIGATTAVWGKMIYEIARAYDYDISFEDAKRLGSDLFKSVILTTAAWFASAKTASFILKFIPVGGTLVGYTIDALVAGIGAKGITARLGTAAALYYKSDKTMAPKTLAEHVKNVAGDPKTIRTALNLAALEVSVQAANDAADFTDNIAT